MRLPKMRPQAASAINITDFSGGLNLRDGTSEILDNQLTDTKNMWWKDGVLKTRPGIEERSQRNVTYSITEWDSAESGIKTHDVYKYDNELGNCRLLSRCVYYKQTENEQNDKTEISFWWVSKTETVGCGRFVLSGIIKSYFVAQKDDVIYCFTSNQQIWSYDGDGWKLLTEDDMYIPLVATQCKTTGSFVKKDKLCGGIAEEGYNLLSNYYKMEYIAYNDDVSFANTSGVREHRMWYPLLNNLIDDKYKGMRLTVIYTRGATEYKFVITLQGRESSVLESEMNGIWKVVYNPVGLRFLDENDEICFVTENSAQDDKIEIIAPYIPDDIEAKRAKVFSMTRSVWFGGTTEGLAGGSRLFLCGNTEENEKSLVCFSGLNKPLYFSEKECFYVGNSSSSVTGFGKQSDKLVIFKENETWYTQYSKSTQGVYFPITQINSDIGCPYPNTVQLCRNRLVWLAENGNVYTLITESKYNERSIYSVSEMVQSRLKQEKYSNPIACDWNGCYCLGFGNKIYLMDYNKYGYIHISSYTKTEDAAIRIPWYYWELGQVDSPYMLVIDSELILISYNRGVETNSSIINISALNENCRKDMEESINSSITTKLFDFSVPNYRKNIERIDLSLGNNGGEPIKVEIITNCGNEEHIVETMSADTQKYNAGYLENYAVFPCIRQISRAAVRLSCKGSLIIDGMSINYRVTSNVR